MNAFQRMRGELLSVLAGGREVKEKVDERLNLNPSLHGARLNYCLLFH